MYYFASYFALIFSIGALLGFAFGYFYRGGRNARVPTMATSPAPVMAPAATPSAELGALPGMTSAVAAAMAQAGVTDLADLRALGQSDDRLLSLADSLRLEDFAVRKWANVAAMQGLRGVDSDLANALLRVGVRGVAALAGENPDRIQNKLAALNAAEGLPAAVPDRQTVAAIIEEAAG